MNISFRRCVKAGLLLAVLSFGSVALAGDSESPLIVAAKTGDVIRVESLLAERSPVNAKDKFGNTPLHWAALNGRKEIAELLLANKADVNAKNKYGATALLLAASTKGHKEIVEVLLAHGADANVKDKDGATPLLEAAVWGYKEIVELLLPRDRSAWPMESLQGMTSVSGVPSSVLDQIKSKAASQWPDDYEMQVYTVKKQTEAYLAIH